MLQSSGNRTISINEKSASYAHRIKPEQISTLEQEFAKAKTLHNTDLELLAAEMGLDEKDVQVSHNSEIFGTKAAGVSHFLTISDYR